MKEERFDDFEKKLICAIIICSFVTFALLYALVYLIHHLTLSVTWWIALGQVAFELLVGLLFVVCGTLTIFFILTLYGLSGYQTSYEESLVKIKKLGSEYSPISLKNTTILSDLVRPADVKAVAQLNEDGKVAVQLCINSTYETDDYIYFLRYFNIRK